MKRRPELLEDMLDSSASAHMDSTEANDAMNLMEVFGETAASSEPEACEVETETCGPSIRLVVKSTDAKVIASEIPQFATPNK